VHRKIFRDFHELVVDCGFTIVGDGGGCGVGELYTKCLYCNIGFLFRSMDGLIKENYENRMGVIGV
jgi:hypothetical protein